MTLNQKFSKDYFDWLEIIAKEYEKHRPFYCRFADTLEKLVNDILKDVNFNFEIKKRTKDIKSFKRKIIRKNYEKPLEQIHDLTGLRIVVRSLSDVKKISSIVRQKFLIDEVNSSNKKDELNPDQFGYSSTHLIIFLDGRKMNISGYEEFKNHRAEIQISTISQALWAGISHEYGYKTEQDIPKDKRRKIHRLAAILELVDLEIKSLITEMSLPIKGEQSEIEAEEPQEDPEDYIKNGYDYFDRGNFPAARDEFDKLSFISTHSFEAHLMLGLIYEVMGDYEPSIEHSKKALEIIPESFNAQFNLAVATNHFYTWKESLPLYLKTEEYAGKQNIGDEVSRGKLNLFIGNNLKDKGDISGAKERYSKAKEILENINTDVARFWLELAVDSLNLLKEDEESH